MAMARPRRVGSDGGWRGVWMTPGFVDFQVQNGRVAWNHPAGIILWLLDSTFGSARYDVKVFFFRNDAAYETTSHAWLVVS